MDMVNIVRLFWPEIQGTTALLHSVCIFASNVTISDENELCLRLNASTLMKSYFLATKKEEKYEKIFDKFGAT